MRAARPFIAAVVTGAAIRAGYLWWMGLPLFDPWRHLELLSNLRAGKGFTLFEQQPYVWYAPLWYRIAAFLPESIDAAWVAGLFSAAAVALLALWLGASEDAALRKGAPWAAFCAAGFGPLVAFTCHYGAEAFALACLLAALAVWARSRGWLPALGAGLLFGVAVSARLSLAFDAFLFLPVLRGPRRAAALAAGAAFPLGLHWLRNYLVLSSQDWVFLWDGLAVRTARFNPLTTFFLQGHPDLAEGLRRLHAQLVPWPEWIVDAKGVRFDLIAFMALALAATIAARRWALLLAAGTTLAYLLVGDRTHSGNFFRLYVGLFPVFCAAFGLVAARFWERPRGRWLAPAVPAAVLLAGLRFLKPDPMYPVEMVTPPAEALPRDAYMVSCGMYQPESLMWRYPGKRFIGLPLLPADFADFHASFPGYRAVIWHAPSVQQELGGALVTDAGFVIVRDVTNEYERRYGILEERGLAAETAPDRSANPPQN